jgi:tryptophanyl-tRNA synthetase
MNSDKPILLSGIKPTGELHIGNYFGAIRQQLELFKSGEYTCYIMIADYHALNFVQDAAKMREEILELAMGYMAVGLDPEHLVLFKQSDVPAHTELAWIFDTLTTMPYLMRAHAFKDAEAKSKEISVGTFNYPMLMAADILLYDAAIVPVGQDQKQHVEIARDTAEKFNRTFTPPNFKKVTIFSDKDTRAALDASVLDKEPTFFKLPEAHIMPEVAVVPGIDGQKMSKSYSNTIPLFASRDLLTERVMSIVTDSSGDRPENVYAIHRLLKTEAELAPLYAQNEGKYKALKEALVEDLDTFIAPMRMRYEELKRNPEAILEVLQKGGEAARAVTDAKMQQVKRAIGVSA